MIKILHGEDIVKSRKRLTEIIEEANREKKEIIYFEGEKVSLEEIRSALESNSLFEKSRLVVIENPKNKPEIFDYLKNYSMREKEESDLILWISEEVDEKILPNAEREFFKPSSLIFSFLDSLFPGNFQKSLKILSQLKESEEPEMIFNMLIRQFRFLILARDLGEAGLPNQPHWRKQKFLNQAKKFTLEKLFAIYQMLLEIDFSQKTSTNPYSLPSYLDLLVLEILK